MYSLNIAATPETRRHQETPGLSRPDFAEAVAGDAG